MHLPWLLPSAASAHSSSKKPKTIPLLVGFVFCSSHAGDRARNTKYSCRGWDSSFMYELRAALCRHLVLIKIIFFLSVFLSRLKKRFEHNRILEWVPNKFPFPKGQVFSKASSGNLQQFIKKRQLYLWPISCIIWMSSEVLESSLFLKCLEAVQHIWCLTSIPNHTNLFNFHSVTSAFCIKKKKEKRKLKILKFLLITPLENPSKY